MARQTGLGGCRKRSPLAALLGVAAMALLLPAITPRTLAFVPLMPPAVAAETAVIAAPASVKDVAAYEIDKEYLADMAAAGVKGTGQTVVIPASVNDGVAYEIDKEYLADWAAAGVKADENQSLVQMGLVGAVVAGLIIVGLVSMSSGDKKESAPAPAKEQKPDDMVEEAQADATSSAEVAPVVIINKEGLARFSVPGPPVGMGKVAAKVAEKAR